MDRRIALRSSSYEGPAPSMKRSSVKRSKRRRRFEEDGKPLHLLPKETQALVKYMEESSEQTLASNARIAAWPDWVRSVVYGAAGRDITDEDGKNIVVAGIGETRWSGLIILQLEKIAKMLGKEMPTLNAMDIIRVLKREPSTKIKGKQFMKPKSDSSPASGATNLRDSAVVREDYSKNYKGNAPGIDTGLASRTRR